MNIKDFKYAWRFTDINYAQFSDSELSEIEIVTSAKANKMWDSVCENPIIQKCTTMIDRIVSRTLPIFIGNCGWGEDDKEESTRYMLESILVKENTASITVMYDRESAITVSANLFVNKWSDFCYPSDTLILFFNHRCLLYYEDTIYYLN
ncbi:MAG: DUF2947 family protein [Oscillospiraceae bacterium]|nr:DUF2947 family protein [Oscillospiraceae bacterium]